MNRIMLFCFCGEISSYVEFVMWLWLVLDR